MNGTGKQERKVDLVPFSQKAGSLYVTRAHGGRAEVKVAGTSARVALLCNNALLGRKALSVYENSIPMT